jgi:hypothetical protein
VVRLAALLLLVGPVSCARPAHTAPEGAPLSPAESRGPEQGPTQKPASVDPIAGLLQARHAEDLPPRSALDAHPDAFAALYWLAWNGDTLAVRARAARLLGQFPEQKPATKLAKLADPALPPPVRAGALDGVAALTPPDRVSALSEIRAGLLDTDPRVALAAVRAAGQVDALRDDVTKASAEHPDARVRAAAGG